MVQNGCLVHDLTFTKLVRPDVSDSARKNAIAVFSWRLETDKQSRLSSCLLSYNPSTEDCYVSPCVNEFSEEIHQLELDDEEFCFDCFLSSLCGQVLSKSFEVDFEDMRDKTSIVSAEEFRHMSFEYS